MIYDLRTGFPQELPTSDIVSYCLKKKKSNFLILNEFVPLAKMMKKN